MRIVIRNSLRSVTSFAREAAFVRSDIPSVLLVAMVTWACDTAVYDYRVKARLPHDPGAYTQGLLFHDGRLYESTGQYGRSDIRVTDVQTGNIIQSRRLPADRFGEGLARLGDRLYQLTWKSGVGYIYELETLALADSFGYAGEGWGLTTDGTSLIISDGTPVLRFLDSATYEVKRELRVTDGGFPLSQINELEYVDGELFANVYQSDWIVRIDIETGEVRERYNLRGLLSTEDRTALSGVLNGIAYNAEERRLFVTGKNWPYLFDIQLTSNASVFPESEP